MAGPPGEESLPRFSPDGKTIAFVGNYEGNEDLYVMPVDGGVPGRITYHPSAELLCDWTADGRLIYSSCVCRLGRQSQLFVRGLDEPQHKQLPVPYGTNGPSAQMVSGWRTHRTAMIIAPGNDIVEEWLRISGFLISPRMSPARSRIIPHRQSADVARQSCVLFVRCRNENRLNIWSYNLQSVERKQITTFADDDCKWPSIGPGADGQGEIILQMELRCIFVALSTGTATKVEITVPGDRPTLRPRSVDAATWASNLSVPHPPNASLLKPRGDIWTIPRKKWITSQPDSYQRSEFDGT